MRYGIGSLELPPYTCWSWAAREVAWSLRFWRVPCRLCPINARIFDAVLKLSSGAGPRYCSSDQFQSRFLGPGDKSGRNAQVRPNCIVGASASLLALWWEKRFQNCSDRSLSELRANSCIFIRPLNGCSARPVTARCQMVPARFGAKVSEEDTCEPVCSKQRFIMPAAQSA